MSQVTFDLPHDAIELISTPLTREIDPEHRCWSCGTKHGAKANPAGRNLPLGSDPDWCDVCGGPIVDPTTSEATELFLEQLPESSSPGRSSAE